MIMMIWRPIEHPDLVSSQYKFYLLLSFLQIFCKNGVLNHCESGINIYLIFLLFTVDIQAALLNRP